MDIIGKKSVCLSQRVPMVVGSGSITSAHSFLQFEQLAGRLKKQSMSQPALYVTAYAQPFQQSAIHLQRSADVV